MYHEGLSHEEIEGAINTKYPKLKRSKRAIRERIGLLRKSSQVNDKTRQLALAQRYGETNTEPSDKALMFKERLRQGYYKNLTSARQGLSRYEVSPFEREQLRAAAEEHFNPKQSTEMTPGVEPEALIDYYHNLTKPPVVPPDISFSTALALLISKKLTKTVADFLVSAHDSGYDIPTLVAALKKVA
jgi:hypothetical protein